MRTFVGRDGNELAADEAGDPNGPAAVLLHGGGQTRHSWGTTLGALGDKGWHAFAVAGTANETRIGDKIAVSFTLRPLGSPASARYTLVAFRGQLRSYGWKLLPLAIASGLGGEMGGLLLMRTFMDEIIFNAWDPHCSKEFAYFDPFVTGSAML